MGENPTEPGTKRLYRSYMITMCLVCALLLSALFLGMAARTRSIMQDELVNYARAYFDTITATRLWNSNFGGVYVEKRPGVDSNPFINTPDIRATDGRLFTLRNPAMMSREISELLGQDRRISFRITSDVLINPRNAPDEFELDAIALFRKGEKEVYRTVRGADGMYFRYMGPLFVNESCLSCHAAQGYREGDVRGGISIRFNIDGIYRKISANMLLVLLFSASTLTLLIASFWFLTRRLIRQLEGARGRLLALAIMDDLTGLHNRRHLMGRLDVEFNRAKRLGSGLSCILIDVDHFKAVNDTHGHIKGDEVLREIASRIGSAVRGYDVAGRYGGEEFMVLLPGTGHTDAMEFARRIAGAIRQSPCHGVQVTASLGVASLVDDDAGMDDLLRRADDMLYRAKGAGRDRVVGNQLENNG